MNKKILKFIMLCLGLGLSSWSLAATITVSAAASLKDAFGEIIRDYEKQYPEAKVYLNTAGSGKLLQQLLQGAPVDVLATADEKTMDQAAAKQAINVASRRTFVHNELVVITPAASKISIQNLADLQQKSLQRIALSNPASVPVGRYSQAVLQQAGLYEALQPKMITTQNVRQSLDYVARDEVDAGFVYRTDATWAGDKVKVVLTVATPTPVSYPIAVTEKTQASAEAARFVNYVCSEKGMAILQRYGFSQPK